MTGFSGAVLIVMAAGAVIALASLGAPRAPELLEPPPDATLSTMTPSFRWHAAPGTTQVEFHLVPDTPAAGISLVQGNTGGFSVPPADQWCCLQAGVTYRWSVRASDSPVPLRPEEQYWGPWSEERRFTVRTTPQ